MSVAKDLSGRLARGCRAGWLLAGSNRMKDLAWQHEYQPSARGS